MAVVVVVGVIVMAFCFSAISIYSIAKVQAVNTDLCEFYSTKLILAYDFNGSNSSLLSLVGQVDSRK